MLSICIVIASIAAAAYLIFKKYYAPGALLFVGLITLGVVACISPDPLITGKKRLILPALMLFRSLPICFRQEPQV